VSTAVPASFVMRMTVDVDASVDVIVSVAAIRSLPETHCRRFPDDGIGILIFLRPFLSFQRHGRRQAPTGKALTDRLTDRLTSRLL
jgi:hypothetical protein